MITETVRAILAHHEDTTAKLNRVISEREAEIALLTQELSRVREYAESRNIVSPSPHATVTLKGNRSKAVVPK